MHVLTLPIVRRMVKHLATHRLVDLSTTGRKHVPSDRAVLLVANNVSYLDAFLIEHALGRRMRFLVPSCYRDIPDLAPFYDTIDSVSLPTVGTRAELRRVCDEAVASLRSGTSVCVFPEGQISRTGNLLPFRWPLDTMAAESGVEIVPVHVDMPVRPPLEPGVWRGILAMTRRMPLRAKVSFGQPLPAGTLLTAARPRIRGLEAAAYFDRPMLSKTLPGAFVDAARRCWARKAVADSLGRDLTYGKLVTGAWLMARWLRSRAPEETVGVLLPATAAGAIANVALSFLGKVAVNLNFTASREAMDVAIDRCEIRHVVTSRAFLEKATVDVPAELIYLEDMRRDVSPARLAVTFVRLTLVNLLSRIVPGLLHRTLLEGPQEPTALATVLFSSGSTGIPKGVMLSHRNILANIEAVQQVFRPEPDDCILGSLPLFHAFGLTVTMWLPLCGGHRVAFHPNPMEVKQIGDLCEKHRVTILVSTPAFCSKYTAKIPPDKFGGLRFGFVGAEALKLSLARTFRAKYGVDLFEGYGTTECAPVVAANLPPVRAPGVHQRASKPGSIGQPVPGVEVKVVHPETYEPLQNGQDGLLLVRGANVMLGYLKERERTAEVLRDGWYVTGDVVRLDDDGYLRITGRLSRFSKIGGEMVPHGKIEEIVQDYTEAEDLVVGVTAVPDAAKGERIVVVHAVELNPGEIAMRMRTDGYPNLWIPRTDSYVPVDALPMLPSGKLALGELAAIAERHFGLANA